MIAINNIRDEVVRDGGFQKIKLPSLEFICVTLLLLELIKEVGSDELYEASLDLFRNSGNPYVQNLLDEV